MAAIEPRAAENEGKSARYYEQMWNKRNLDVIEDWIAPNFVGHYSGLPDDVHGVDGFRATIEMLLEAFPDLRLTVEDMVARDDKVVTRFSIRGTHLGELDGYAPTGATVTIQAMGIETYAEGKCIEEWVWFDDLKLARQIGVLPNPGTRTDGMGRLVHRIAARRMRRGR